MTAIQACGLIYMHSPERAREKANEFLSFLYTEKNMDKAYAMTNKFYRDNFGIQTLAKGSALFLSKYGKFEGTKALYYFSEGGSREISIFYQALSEGGITYHKVDLTDEGRNGYTISGIAISEKPFTGYRLIKPFKDKE
jgi:hypothetical protein